MSAPKIQLRDGFAGQEMFVIPRPALAAVSSHPLVRSIYPTDIGWFPAAAHHYRERPNGARQDHLMLCVNGSGHLTIDGQRLRLRANEMIVIPRDTPHSYWADDEDPWSIYWVHFQGEDVDYLTGRLPRIRQAVPVERSALE